MRDWHSIKAEAAVRQLFYQKIERVSRAFISLFSLACWLREQRLRKFNSKDFTSDGRKMENEIINYSEYKKEQNAFNQIELQMDD